LPTADQTFPAGLRDPAALEAHLLDDPDFYGCAGNTLTVGTVPERGWVGRERS
jgi:hypothetical protein